MEALALNREPLISTPPIIIISVIRASKYSVSKVIKMFSHLDVNILEQKACNNDDDDKEHRLTIEETNCKNF